MCVCVPACRSDPEIMSSAAAMLELYRTQKEALIHNDLHAGMCLCVGGERTQVETQESEVKMQELKLF